MIDTQLIEGRKPLLGLDLFAMSIFVILIALLLGGTGAIVFYDLRTRRTLLGASLERKKELVEQLEKISPTLKTASEQLPTMIPLSEFTTAHSELLSLTQSLNENRKIASELHDKLLDKQREVEKKELRQNQIKAKREECMDKADEIAGSKEELEAAFMRLQMELEQSRSQMNSLSDEVELKAYQKKAVEEISASLISSCRQLENLQEEYTESCDRFLNLEHQYKELETEYARLVEKELDKNPWMKTK